MSTRITLKHKNADDDTDFHLYLECFEADAVYLQLRNCKHFVASNNEVVVRIPQEVFEKFASEEVLKRLKSHSKAVRDFDERIANES